MQRIKDMTVPNQMNGVLAVFFLGWSLYGPNWMGVVFGVLVLVCSIWQEAKFQ